MRDAGHLLRLAAVLVAGVALFLVVRQMVVPKDFGKLGHYRPGALEDNRARLAAFAGQANCEPCHDEVVVARKGGRHEKISCEACHGPLARHADKPTEFKPVLPAAAPLCQRCHEKDAAKPRTFPQVVSKEHSGGEDCKTCHKPHKPKV